MSEEELKTLPCPYCSCFNIGIMRLTSSPFCYCPRCGMKGPRKFKCDDAIAAWNSLPRKGEQHVN